MKIDSARATARKDTLGHVQYPWRTALRVQESTLGSTATTDVEEEANLNKESNKRNDEYNSGDDVG